MKVLLLNIGYFGGGSERCVRELLQHWPRLGVEAELWVPRVEPGVPQQVRAMRRPLENALSFLEAAPFWSDARHRGSHRLLDALEPGDFDLIHLHVIHSGTASIKALERLCHRFPVVWTQHDEWAATGGNGCLLEGKISPRRVREMTPGLMGYLPYHPYHQNPRFRLYRRFLNRWMPQPRTLISPSLHLLQRLRESGRFSRSTLNHLPNGLALLERDDLNQSRQQARLDLGLNPDKQVILLVAGNLRQVHKGAALGIEAINRLPADIDAQVLLLGKNTQPFARRISRLPVRDAYAADDAALVRAYRAASVTLIPSLADNFPYVGLESLACRTPLVAFRIGGPAEIVGDNLHGLLAQPFDTNQLSHDLATLLGDQARRDALGQAGQAWVARQCDMNHYLQSLLAIYRETIAAGPLTFS